MADQKVSSDVRGKVAEGAKVARERLDGVARSVEERYQKVAEEMRREAERASATAREKMAEARERYGDTVEELREGYTKVRKDVDSLSSDVNEYVRDNPAKAVVGAAAVGFLLGLLFRGGRD